MVFINASRENLESDALGKSYDENCAGKYL